MRATEAVKDVARETDTQALKAAGFVVVRPTLQVPGRAK